MRVWELMDVLKDRDQDAFVGVRVSDFEKRPRRVLDAHPAVLHFSLSDELVVSFSEAPHVPTTTSFVYLFVSLDGRFVNPTNGRGFSETTADSAIPAAFAERPSPAGPRPRKAGQIRRKGKRK